MRTAAASLILIVGMTGFARAQAIMMPANADMRAMSAPIDWEGSRAQTEQDKDSYYARPSRSFLSGLFGSGNSEPEASAAAPSAAAQDKQALAATSAKQGPMDYRIDLMDTNGHVVETIARLSDLSIARAAYKQALKERPKAKIALLQGETVVATK